MTSSPDVATPAPLITPADLTTPPYREFIEHLAVRWVLAELPSHLPDIVPYLYEDYQMAVGVLLINVQRTAQTRHVFMATLSQAVALGKSSLWLEKELMFEATCFVVQMSRADVLRLDLRLAGENDLANLDVHLDLHNERLVRFDSTPTSDRP